MYKRNIQESLFHLFLRRLTGQLNINSVCKSKRMLSNIGVREGKNQAGWKEIYPTFPHCARLIEKNIIFVEIPPYVYIFWYFQILYCICLLFKVISHIFPDFLGFTKALCNECDGGSTSNVLMLMLYWSEKMIRNSMYLPPRLIHKTNNRLTLIAVFCFRVDSPSLL